MEPIWLASYPPGVPPSLGLDPRVSLVDIFEESCRKFAQQPAFSNFGRSITYAELDAQSASFAAWLQQEAGLEPGDRVALMMPNLLQYPVALFGVLRAGMVVVSVNPLYTSREVQHQLRDAGAKVIVVVENSAAELAEVVADTPVEQVVITGIGDRLGFPKRQLVNFAVRHIKRLVRPFRLPSAVHMDTVMSTDASRFQRVDVRGHQLACLQYTGGTTGKSKGARLSHANLVANVRQINTWFESLIEPGVETIITALPLYHVYAMTCNCLAYVELGALNVLITNPRDIKGFIKELRRWKFTAITGVNTLYQALTDHPDLPSVDFSKLKLVSAGGMAVQEFTARQWHEITGTAILEGYGLSETSPVITTNRPDLEKYSGSIGLPLPDTEVTLRDNEGREVQLGEPGELWVRGPQVMDGYWQDAEGTAEAMTDDGFFKTGDIATVNAEGFFRIVDRKKDMILVSAFNVYPNEIEQVLTLHEDIVEAAVIGVPDAHHNEAVKAFVVKRPGSTLTESAVRAFCRENLTAYKVPKTVEFRTELPKSNIGKILRRELRDEALKQVDG